jgi:hypothetical protein
MKDITETVERAVRTVYSKYIDPLPKDERIPLQLLVGVFSRDHGLTLFKTDRTTATPVDRFDVIGTGGVLAQLMIEILDTPYYNLVSDARLLGIYALRVAMEYDTYTGKASRMKILYQDGQIETASPEEVSDTENFFARLFLSIQDILRVALYSEIPVESIESTADIKGIIMEFRERHERRKVK